MCGELTFVNVDEKNNCLLKSRYQKILYFLTFIFPNLQIFPGRSQMGKKT